VGVVIFNNVYSSRWKISMFMTENNSISIPAVFISREYGTLLQRGLTGHSEAPREQLSVSITSEGSVPPHNLLTQSPVHKVSIYTMVVFFLFVMGLSFGALVMVVISREDAVSTDSSILVSLMQL
jgi:hypothetical protein